MRLLRFELAFRAWVEARGMGWQTFQYPRPEAQGRTTAHKLTPRGAVRGVVLMVHGAGNDSLFGIVGLSKLLLGRGFEVFAFDLDGHGRNSTTRLFPDAIAGAVPAAAEATGAARSGLPLHGIGVSLGSSLLLQALPSLGPTLESATLFCTPLHVRLTRAGILREVSPALLRTIWRERGHYGLTGLIPSFAGFKRDDYPLRLGVPPGPGPFGYVDVLNASLDDLDLLAAARKAPVPVLVFHGDADGLVSHESSERIARHLPLSELHLLRGETHLSAPFARSAVDRLLEWVEAR